MVNYHKNAITLVELLISVTITSVIMVLLFSIVGKKATIVSSYERGTFYCWKDWNDYLYQKTPTGSIQHVSNCMVKIPKNAKNIKVYAIGGGSAGFYVSNSKIQSELHSIPPISPPLEQTCVKTDKIYDGYTDIVKGNTSASQQLQKDKYKETKLEVKSINPTYFNDSFSIFLISKNKCFVPFYYKGELKTVPVPKNAEYYSPGKEDYVFCEDNRVAKCYNNGYFLDKNGSRLTDYVALNDQNSKLSLKVLAPTLRLSYGSPQAGSVKEATLMPGEEYTISASSIGSGGKIGAMNGGIVGKGSDTNFKGVIIASGGKIVTKTIDVSYPIDKIIKIASINDLVQHVKIEDIRKKEDRYAKFNEELLAIPGLGLKSDIKIGIDFNPDTQDEVIKTGFGLFGASGVNPIGSYENCLIKELKYYGYSIINTNWITNFPLNPIRGFTNGMGGAIIIKWD